MRKSVGTIGTMLVAGLLCATARQVQLLAMTEEHPLATNQQDVSEKAANDDTSPLSAESVKRLKDIGVGQFQITPTREDVPLVLRAMQDKDLTISSHACLAVEKMSPKNLFRPEDLKPLWEGLRPKFRSEHQSTSEWSTRAVGAIVGQTELLKDAFLPDQEWRLGRKPYDTERLAGEFLYGAFDENLLMLSSSDLELQRRGANLSSSLLKLLPKEKQEKLVRGLLAIPFETGADRKPNSTEVRCGSCVTSALVNAAPKIKSEALANDVAARLFESVREKDHVTMFGVHRGLAFLADNTSHEIREQIVGAVLTAAADGQLVYSLTSGVDSPPKHRGADALAILAESLTGEELEKAEQAIPPLAAGQKTEIYNSMYGRAKEALAARKLLLEEQKQAAMSSDKLDNQYPKNITSVVPGEDEDLDSLEGKWIDTAKTDQAHPLEIAAEGDKWTGDWGNGKVSLQLFYDVSDTEAARLPGKRLQEKAILKHGMAVFDDGFADRILTLHVVDGELLVESFTVFKDKSKRPNYWTQLNFRKS